MNQTIGQRISTLRKKKNLTQEGLADLLSVSGQAVSKWEQDRSYPDILLLPTMAKILGVTVDELLTGEAPVSEESEAMEKEEYADRVMKVQVVSRLWIQNVKLSLSSVENAESLRAYFPEETFAELKSQLESGVQLAKKGALGTVFSYVTQPLIVQIKVMTLNDLEEEDEEDDDEEYEE